MSAIFGLVSLDNRPIDIIDLEKMNRALAGSESEPESVWRGERVALGQRLTAFTPEDSFERQPLFSAANDIVLVSDARLDNRQELAATLNVPAASAAILPDSHFILRAYELWGTECVQRLIGVFAFALWDARQQLLFAARSQLGGRTLFYHATRRLFAFASRPRGLVAHRAIERQLNEEKVADYLVRTDRDPTATFYKGVHSLPLGHQLICGPRGLEIRRYWQLDLGRDIRFRRDEEYVDAFAELFERVITAQLRSATPLGAMMSGGLDSTAVVAVAAAQLDAAGRRLTAFTEVPRAEFERPLRAHNYADETQFAEAVASRYANLDLQLVRTDGRNFLQDLDRFFTFADEPFLNTANRVWWEEILQRARQAGSRVLLTGDYGNLTASWTGSGLVAQLLRRGAWRSAWREAQATAAGNVITSLKMLATQGVIPLLPGPLWHTLQFLRGEREAVSPDGWRQFSPINPNFAREQRVTLNKGAAGWGASVLRSPTPDTRRYRQTLIEIFGVDANQGGAYRAMYGVDTRSPLLDQRVVEFCLALPEEQYRRHGESRRLIRRAMAGRLPVEVLQNRQRGLQAADWFERLGAARPEIAANLARFESNALVQSALDLPRLRGLLEHWPSDNMRTLDTLEQYRQTLQTGLMMGRFLLWFEAQG